MTDMKDAILAQSVWATVLIFLTLVVLDTVEVISYRHCAVRVIQYTVEGDPKEICRR